MAACFSDEQNAALREALRQATDKLGSQAAVAKAIGIQQQNVSLALRGGGFRYPSAKALVRLLGYRSVDAFFAAHEAA